jgi:hypoxia up-regulated 1
MHEAAKRAREDARNMLESYLYRMRDLLASESETSPFVKCSKDSERTEIAAKLSDAFSWMSERADEAETNQLVEQRLAIVYALRRLYWHFR